MTNFLLKHPLRLSQDLRNFTQNSTAIGLKFLSSLTQTPQSTNNRTVDYFVNTVGLSKDSALAVAKRIHLKPTADPDSVLALFNAYGFTPSHTATIFRRYPTLLLADPYKTFEPKFVFLSKNGISGNVLVDVISRDPLILRRSLNKQIIPCIDFLRKFFGSTDGIVSHFSAKRGTWLLQKFSVSVAPNIEVLRFNGVPDTTIAKMFRVRPGTLCRRVEDFIDIVERTKETGFNPSSLMFIYGLCSLSGMRKEKWLLKLHIFKSFGWSEDQFQSMFLKQPMLMTASEEHIKRVLDLLMNKLDWSLEEISKYPVVFNLSFEKRVMPRSSILQHLISKGFIKKTSVGKGFIIAEDKFLVQFVMQYLSKDPHLLEMYKEKMGIL